MAELNHGMLTYEDDPQPHLGNGPTWPEFLKAWRDMEAKGWPEVGTEPPPAEIIVTKEQRERLKAHIAKMADEPSGPSRIKTGLIEIPESHEERVKMLDEMLQKAEGLPRPEFPCGIGYKAYKVLEEKYNKIFGKRKK